MLDNVDLTGFAGETDFGGTTGATVGLGLGVASLTGSTEGALATAGDGPAAIGITSAS